MSQPGITIGSGITFGAGTSAGAAAVGSGAFSYAQMNPPIIPGQQLEDGSATINGTTGFTINNGSATGVAVTGLDPALITYYQNLGTGNHTMMFGAGSTYPTASINITSLPTSGPLIFYIDQALTYPATFNFPFSISI